jgi:hypothetical protein
MTGLTPLSDTASYEQIALNEILQRCNLRIERRMKGQQVFLVVKRIDTTRHATNGHFTDEDKRDVKLAILRSFIERKLGLDQAYCHIVPTMAGRALLHLRVWNLSTDGSLVALHNDVAKKVSSQLAFDETRMMMVKQVLEKYSLTSSIIHKGIAPDHFEVMSVQSTDQFAALARSSENFYQELEIAWERLVRSHSSTSTQTGFRP